VSSWSGNPRGTVVTDGESTAILQKIGNCSLYESGSHPRKPESSLCIALYNSVNCLLDVLFVTAEEEEQGEEAEEAISDQEFNTG
jgi:hypothetical protein